MFKNNIRTRKGKADLRTIDLGNYWELLGENLSVPSVLYGSVFPMSNQSILGALHLASGRGVPFEHHSDDPMLYRI